MGPSIVHALGAGLLQAVQFFWESLFGLVFGFLISAIAQVALTPATLHRYLGPNPRGILFGAAFGIISSSCSYGSAAAARGFYQRGADVRAIFSFLISSTNMNVAILILFWSLLGWKFAFAEFFGGVIIIAVVVTGLSALFRPETLQRLRSEHTSAGNKAAGVVRECPVCGMEGNRNLALEYQGQTYLACSTKHRDDLAADPARYLGGETPAAPSPAVTGWSALGRARTWRAIGATAAGDVSMLRSELLVGYLLAGFAAALVPPGRLAHALQTVGAVPYAGYVLLLAAGLLIAVLSFVCSMGNVPVARFLASAGIPLGANTAFIYGDLLVPPLIAIYSKSFPAPITRAFVILFVVGAMLAGATMELTIGNVFGGVSMGSMEFNDRFTTISNIMAIGAVAAVWAVTRAGSSGRRPA